MRWFVSLALVAVGVLVASQLAAENAPRELGTVKWQRDLDRALAASEADGRPVFLLFQEVPGCATCVNFGDQVLSHPTLVEAIETEFHPVFIYNNRPGRDAGIRDRYDEPAWNNPVVRFVDGSGGDLLPRRAGIWTPETIGQRMVASLEASGRPVPAYLATTVDELEPRATERATFGMFCYWSGEACLGEIPGVQSSRTGYLRGSEVVEVIFDPAEISYPDLLRRARSCADRVYAHDGTQQTAAEAIFGGDAIAEKGPIRQAADKDQKYFLRRAGLAGLALTPRQATRVNSAVRWGRDPRVHLSPRQQAMLPRRAL